MSREDGRGFSLTRKGASTLRGVHNADKYGRKRKPKAAPKPAAMKSSTNKGARPSINPSNAYRKTTKDTGGSINPRRAYTDGKPRVSASGQTPATGYVGPSKPKTSGPTSRPNNNPTRNKDASRAFKGNPAVAKSTPRSSNSSSTPKAPKKKNAYERMSWSDMLFKNRDRTAGAAERSAKAKAKKKRWWEK